MEIWELSASELRERLERRELSAVEVVEALIVRRRAVDPAVRAFVAECEDALSAAAAVDEARSRGEWLPPLAGLPITIKDNVDLAGHDSTLGFRARVGHPAAQDAVLVDSLRRAGAVFLGKTNVPQALLAQETENPVFGVTHNPWNLDKTPGGSSGGEAAAIAAGMTPWGIGTDIGGSIRIPAHFCGVVGFKPTLDRWSNRGSNTAIPGQELVRAQIGALARTVDDVALLWRSLDVAQMSAEDPHVPPLPAGDPGAVDLSGLRVGVIEDDEFLPPVASLRRAVREARNALEAAGAVVVEYAPVPSAEILSLWLSAISSDRGRTLDRGLAGDDISPQLKPSRALLKVPAPMRWAASRLLGGLGQRRLALVLGALGEKSVDQLWEITSRRTALRQREFDAWNRAGLDAVLCPPHVVPALGHRESGDYAVSLAAEFRWTLLNFPAGIVPVTRVRPDDVGSYREDDRVTKKTAAIDRDSIGLPVGVQLVARPYREDHLLALMAAVEAAARRAADFPTTPVTPS